MTNRMAPSREGRPLSSFQEGTEVEVRTIAGGKGARKKLYDLGIVPGASVTIAQGTFNYPYVLRIGGSRIMLGWGMVQKIFVCEKG